MKKAILIVVVTLLAAACFVTGLLYERRVASPYRAVSIYDETKDAADAFSRIVALEEGRLAPVRTYSQVRLNAYIINLGGFIASSKDTRGVGEATALLGRIAKHRSKHPAVYSDESNSLGAFDHNGSARAQAVLDEVMANLGVG